jgi:parallel beta-helix repeat protein
LPFKPKTAPAAAVTPISFILLLIKAKGIEMKRRENKGIQHLVIAIAAAWFILCSINTAEAETFCVQTSGELQSALNTAATNEEADVIQLVQGTYTGNFTYEVHAVQQEAYQLTIKGGYASGCFSRVVNASNTVLDGNSAGSAFMIDDWYGVNFECDGVTFQNGSAARGGGLHVGSLGDVMLSNSAVSGNRATEFGGGIYINSTAGITLTNNTISNNECPQSAGASLIGGEAIVLTANRIKGNTSDEAVGGILAHGPSVSFTNNLFYDNNALYYDGISIEINSNLIRVINNTIVNTGIRIELSDGSRADVYNNIIYDNSGNEANDLRIYNDYDEDGVASPVSLLNNDFDQSSTGTYIQIPFTIDSSNLNNQNPLFVDSSTGDYHLAKGSPCIDTGTSTDAPATDMAGTSRPRGQGYDMGAYEYVGVPLPDIKANGKNGSITVSSGTPVSITLSLDPDNLSGQNVDWWVVELTPSSTYNHFDLSTGSMVQGLSPTHQGPLFNLGTTTLLNSSDLSVGTHIFYFAVDMNMNGSLDMNFIYYDSVGVNVTEP